MPWDSMSEQTPLYLPTTRECMTCGFCLQSCPTYSITGAEAQSPRGRVRLLDRIANGEDLNSAERQSLEDCLQCRTCESACPSEMPFGRALDRAKAQLKSR